MHRCDGSRWWSPRRPRSSSSPSRTRSATPAERQHDEIPHGEALLDRVRAHELLSRGPCHRGPGARPGRGRASAGAIPAPARPAPRDRRVHRARWPGRDAAAHRVQPRPAPRVTFPPAPERAGGQPTSLAGGRPVGPGARGQLLLVRALRCRRRAASAAGLRERWLPRRLRRSLSRRQAALVRHADLRQPAKVARHRARTRAGGRGSRAAVAD